MPLLTRRLWTPTERANARALQDATPHVSYLMPTATGLRKSIMDAITPLREFLRDEAIHDYAAQRQGSTGMVRDQARIVTDARLVDTIVSMYRPVTKQGDPRIWFGRLGSCAAPGDILAIFPWDDRLHVLNLTASHLAADVAAGRSTASTTLLGAIQQAGERDAMELLSMIEAVVVNGPIEADGQGDTSIGRTLETALGIKMNSSKVADWRKIEIKSSRSARANRKNLFAQVPEWRLSGAKSSAEILARFGYERPGSDRKLYVTVNAVRYNAQGLRLQVDPKAEAIVEVSLDPQMPVVAVWPLSVLRQRLREKHAETFWVDADSTFVGGIEHFRYTQIVHTRAPVVAQLEPLIEAGHITLDHLIKDVGGRVVEKGPLFKVDEEGLRLLFPAPRAYTLRTTVGIGDGVTEGAP